MRSFRSVLFLFVLCVLPPEARAEDSTRGEAIYGPDGAPTVVQRKLYVMKSKWETGLAATFALNTSLVNQYGGIASVSYHPNEWGDLGIDLVANYTQLSGLSSQIRANLPARATGGTATVGDEISHADQFRGGGFLTARVAPIYGKLNLASEVAVHFQAYALLGAGAGAFKHESINLCATAGSAPCAPGDFQSSTSVRPVGELGAGMRFYVGRRMSLRAELRGFLHPASYTRGADLTQPGSGSSKDYLGFIALFALGASALF
jgi:outer membrane beta-barrel protein